MKVFGISDQGKVRANNQDAFRIDPNPEGALAVAVLCDGMGGVRGGEIASSIASEAFVTCVQGELLDPGTPDLADIGRESAAYANLKVYDRSQRDESCRGMGTTLVAAIVRQTDAVMVNIGDSRGYWLANGQIQQVTRDHSHVQDLVDQGIITQGEARSHPRKNLITRAVGVTNRIRSDIFRLDLREGDRLLLCSDGLSNLLTEEEIGAELSKEDLESACRRLLEQALNRGAPDNVTIVALER